MLGKLLPREKYCTKSVFYFLCILRFCLLSLEIKSLPIYFCCPLSLCRDIMQWWFFIWHTGLCHVIGIGTNEVYYHKNLGHYLSLLQVIYFQKKNLMLCFIPNMYQIIYNTYHCPSSYNVCMSQGKRTAAMGLEHFFLNI